MDESNEEDERGFKKHLAASLYQVKLVYLFLWRGWKNNYSFRLGTEIKAGEKFDDLVFYHKKANEERYRALFLQAKHSGSDKAKMRYEDFVSTREKAICNLKKYFASFRKIQQKIKDGVPDEFVLCSNIPFKDLMLKKRELDCEEDALKFEEIEENQENYNNVLCGFKKYKLIQRNEELNQMFCQVSDLSILAHELAKCFVESELKETNVMELEMDNFWFSQYFEALINEKVVEEQKETVRFQKSFWELKRKADKNEDKEKKATKKNTEMMSEFIKIFVEICVNEYPTLLEKLENIRHNEKFIEILKSKDRFKQNTFQALEKEEQTALLTKISRILLKNLCNSENFEFEEDIKSNVGMFKEILTISKVNVFSTNFVTGNDNNVRVSKFRHTFFNYCKKLMLESRSQKLMELAEIFDTSFNQKLKNKTIIFKPAVNEMGKFVEKIIDAAYNHVELDLTPHSKFEELIDGVFDFTENEMIFMDKFFKEKPQTDETKLFKEIMEKKIVNKTFNLTNCGIKLTKSPPWHNESDMDALVEYTIRNKNVDQQREINNAANEILKCLAKKVFVSTEKENVIKFKSSFFTSENLSKSANLFKEKLKKELKDESLDVLKDFEMKVTDFPFCCDSLIERGNIENEIEEFCQKLVFVTTPGENELHNLVAKELSDEFNLLIADIASDTLFIKVLDRIKVDEEKFLETKDADEFMKQIKKNIVSLLTMGYNSVYSEKLKSYNILYKQSYIDGFMESLNSFITSPEKQILHLKTEELLLTALKVDQGLRHYENKNFIFNNLSSLLLMEKCSEKGKEAKYASSAFEDTANLLIIVEEKTSEKFTPFCKRICQILLKNPIKKIVVIENPQNQLINQIKADFEYNELEEKYEIFLETITDWENIGNIENVEEVLTKEIIFQGKPVQLNDLISKENFADLIDYETLQKLLMGEEVSIAKQPPSSKEYEKEYYIPRDIGLNALKHEIFHNLHDFKDHIFAIEGNSIIEVETVLLENGVFAHQIHHAQESFDFNAEEVVFVIVEPKKENDQFHAICKKYEKFSIHWLKLSNNKAIWLDSNISLFESVSSLSSYVEKYFVTEDEFLMHISQSQVVLMTASAGMGKSTFLTNLTQHNIKKWIVRIDLNHHTDILSNMKGNLSLQKTKFNLNFSNIGKNTHDYAKIVLSSFCNDENVIEKKLSFEDKIFQYFFLSNKMVIVFDGFDEIAPDYESTVKDVISKIKNHCQNQLWITSRTLFEKQLEEKFGTLSYSLSPFNEENQKQFLIKYWENKWKEKRNFDELVSILLETYVGVLLLSLNCGDMLGSPLHLKMIGEIFQEENNLNYNAESPYKIEQGCFHYINVRMEDKLNNLCDYIDNKIPFLEIIKEQYRKMVYLYNEFVKKKIFDYFLKEKWKIDLTNVNVKGMASERFDRENRIHSILAINKLVGVNMDYPTPEEKKEVLTWIEQFDNGANKVGFVDKINENIVFVHATYAEYFACVYIIDKLKNTRDSKIMFKIVDKLLQQEIHLLNESLQIFFEEKKNDNLHEYKTGTEYTTMLNFLAYEELLSCIKIGIRCDKIFNVDQNGKTILHYASKNRSVIVFLILYVYGALMESSHNHSLSMYYLMLFVKHKDKNQREALDYTNDSIVSTLLKYIISTGENGLKRKFFEFNDLCSLKISEGYQNVIYSFFLYNFDYAAIKDVLSVVDFTSLKHNISVEMMLNLCSRTDLTEENKREIYQILCSKISDVEIKSIIVTAILHDAVRNNCVYVFNYFKTMVNEKMLITCFSEACRTNVLEMVKLLHEHCKELNTTNSTFEFNPLHIAIEEHASLKIIRYIIENNPNAVNSKDQSGDTPLLIALKEDFVEQKILKLVIENGAAPEICNKLNKTAYDYIVEKKQDDILVFFFKTIKNNKSVWSQWIRDIWDYYNTESFNINTKFDGQTRLHQAIITGNESYCKFLIPRLTDINAKDNYGKTHLHYACENDMFDTVVLLLENGASYNEEDNEQRTPSSKNYEIQRLFDEISSFYESKKGRDFFPTYSLGSIDKTKSTILHKSINDMTTLYLFIAKDTFNININQQDINGNTALHLAAEKGYIESVVMLIDKGADTYIENKEGKTAKEMARKSGHSKVIPFFRLYEQNFNWLKTMETYKRKARCCNLTFSVETKDKNGRTLLHFAVLNTNPLLVKALIIHNANVNSQDNDKRTPLFYAVQLNNLHITEILLKHGAFLDIKEICQINPNPCTKVIEQINKAFDYIYNEEVDLFKNYLESLDMKISSHIFINVLDMHKKSFISYSLFLNDYDFIKYLLQNGATISKDDYRKQIRPCDTYHFNKKIFFHTEFYHHEDDKTENLLKGYEKTLNLFSTIEIIFKGVRENFYEATSLINYIERNKLTNLLTTLFWDNIYGNVFHRSIPKTLLQESLISNENQIMKWLIKCGAKNIPLESYGCISQQTLKNPIYEKLYRLV